MSLLYEFTATPGNTSFSMRVEKALQHLDIKRIAPLAIFFAGLLAGIPEKVSAEITHPSRERVRSADSVSLSHIAFWGQHGRGPIVESAPATLRASTSPNGAVGPGGGGGVQSFTGSGAESILDGAAQLYTSSFKYYFNDKGPVEVLADDHFIVKFENLVVGATYQIHGPEQQVVAAHSNKYYDYDPGIILATDRERRLAATGKDGIILPNRPDVIERVLLNLRDVDGNKSEKEANMFELLAMQTDLNPFTSVLNYKSDDPTQRATLLASSGEADLLLVMFANVDSIQIDTVIGQELRYTLVSTLDRV